MMFLFPAIIFIHCITVLVNGEATAVINTTSGPVRGEIISTAWHSVKYAAFKSIKYGEPPVGYLRFQPPVPVVPWTEIYNATVKAAECVQLDFYSNAVSGTEDCLYLNVYTPVTNLEETPSVLKSVMVWIYGGTWVIGSSSSCEYSPDFLVERDVVVVSLNYRLGALGFLSLNHANATGNAGLKDQQLALKWVQANIEKFGGNPKNVTIFGESAGAVSVGFHTLSDSSAGLFHGAISMSGTPIVPWGFQIPAKAALKARKLGTFIGTQSSDTETVLKALYNASAADLVKATANNGPIISFAPTLEDPAIATNVFMSECSIRKYYSGKFNKVPQILGFMQQETLTFVTYAKSLYQLVNDAVELLRTTGKFVPHILEKILNSVATDLNAVKREVIEFIVNETTDQFFKTPIDMTQKILAKHNGDYSVYYYENSFYTDRNLHNIEFNSSILGAGHTDDIAQLFYIPYANYTLDTDNPITRSIHRLTTMWTNFAKYGNPTPDWVNEYPLNVTWPVSGKAGRALNIGNELTVVSRPTNLNVKYTEIFEKLGLKKTNGC